MEFNKDELKAFECANSNGQHYLSEPISLSCGHMICKKCITTTPIKCSVCGNVNQHDLTKANVVEFFELLIIKNLNQLLEKTLEKFNESFVKFKNLKASASTSIDNAIEFLKGNVNTRIETLKNELDKLKGRYMEDLENIKKKSLDSLDTMDKSETFDKYLTELKNIIESKSENCDNKSLLNEYQEHLRNMKTLSEKMEEFVKYEVEFEPSSIDIDESIVGTFLLDNTPLIKKVRKAISSISSDQFERKKIQFTPLHCIVLPNSNILYSCSTKNVQYGLALYDSDFNLVKTVSEIGRQKLDRMAGIAIDDTSIYLAACGNKLIKTDLELSSIKKQIEIVRPLALMYSNNNIFVSGEYCVKRFSTDLVQLYEYALPFTPRNIKILNRTAFLRPFDEFAMYFYEITDNEFKLKQKLEDHNGIIGIVDSVFLEYDDVEGIMYRYNSSGELIEEMISNKYGSCQGSIICVNDKLIIPLICGDIIVIKFENS